MFSPVMPDTMQKGDRFGDYRIIDELGRGGMGVVYHATDADGNEVALKILHVKAGPGSDIVQRFDREAEIALSLRHDHVVPALDAGAVGQHRYLATRYVAGCDLSHLVHGCGQLGESEAVSLARDLASALQVVSDHGTIHRDLKPGNVLIDLDGKALLTDFGLARPSDAALSRLTQTGTFLGTPGYAAPEQVLGDGRDIDIRSDLYSLGTVIFFALMGRAPYEGRNRFDIFQQHLDAPIPDLGRLRDDLDAPLVRLVTRLLQKDPSRRPQCPADLVEQLDDHFSAADYEEGREGLAISVQ